MSVEYHKKNYLYKIIVVGDVYVGKTSIIHRYAHGKFTTNYKSTIGVDFALKTLNRDDGTVIRLQLWDIAGQERYGNMTRVYYREAVGALLVFDLSKKTTFENILKWKEDLDNKIRLPNGDKLPVMLLGNKNDLERDCPLITDEDFDNYCKNNEFGGWALTSAKTGNGIDEICEQLVQIVLKTSPNFSTSDDIIDITPAKTQLLEEEKSKCC